MVVRGCRFEELRSSQDGTSLWASARLDARTSPRRTLFVSCGNQPSTFGPSPRQISPHNNTRHGSLRRSSRRYALCVLEGFQEAWIREFSGRMQPTSLMRMCTDPALHLPPPVQGRRHCRRCCQWYGHTHDRQSHADGLTTEQVPCRRVCLTRFTTERLALSTM